MKITAYSLFLFIFLGCSHPDGILVGNDFETGDWLLVHVNDSKNILELIDDEQILKANQDELYVTTSGYCGGTTCDGFLKLYKDGKLIAQHEYLEYSTLYESPLIIKHYKKTENWSMRPNESVFTKTWDSLKSSGCYPTICHIQPDDKDIIIVYKKLANRLNTFIKSLSV